MSSASRETEPGESSAAPAKEAGVGNASHSSQAQSTALPDDIRAKEFDATEMDFKEYRNATSNSSVTEAVEKPDERTAETGPEEEPKPGERSKAVTTLIMFALCVRVLNCFICSPG